MIQLSSEQEVLLRRKLYKEEPLFQLLCIPLAGLNPTFTKLSPVSIWIESAKFAQVLFDLAEPGEETEFEIKALNEQYGSEAIVIASTTLFILSASRKNFQVDEIIKELMPFCYRYQLYHHLFLSIQKHEEERKKMGKQLDIWNYKLSEIECSSDAKKGYLEDILEYLLSKKPEDAIFSFMLMDWKFESKPIWKKIRGPIKERLIEYEKSIREQNDAILGSLKQIAGNTEKAANRPQIGKLVLGDYFEGIPPTNQDGISKLLLNDNLPEIINNFLSNGH